MVFDGHFVHFRLTAFVVKSFSRAKSYIYIDHVSMGKSIEFMLSRQQKDGSFEESGSVSSYLQVCERCEVFFQIYLNFSLFN